jgi:hypothetical protein
MWRVGGVLDPGDSAKGSTSADQAMELAWSLQRLSGNLVM